MSDLGDKKQDIQCKDTGKLLARRDEQGIYLYCKQCRVEHLVSWQELGRATRELIMANERQ